MFYLVSYAMAVAEGRLPAGPLAVEAYLAAGGVPVLAVAS